jgi:WD40 repeat protein
MGDASPAGPAETSDPKPSWPKFSLAISVFLWLLAWELIVWFVPVQPRVLISTSDRLEGFSPDGQTLVTGLQHDSFLTGQIRLWDVKNGQELEVLGEMGTNLLPNVVYSGQRDLLYENRICEKFDPKVNRRITLVLFDLKTRHETGLIRLDCADLFTCHALCFAPDGQTLVICTSRETDDSGDLKLVDVATGQVRAHLEGGGYRELVFSPDGNTLAIIQAQPHADDKDLEEVAVVLLDTATGQTRKKLKSDGAALFPLGFSPDGQKLAAYCFNFNTNVDGFKDEVKLWNLSGQNMMSLKGERFAAFLPDGKGLATCDEDRHTIIRFVDQVIGKEFAVVNNPSSYDWCSTFFMPIPGTDLLVIPTTHDVKPNLFFQRWGAFLGIMGRGAERHDQELAFLDTRTGKKVASIVREGMGDPRISTDGQSLAVPSFDEKFIEIWDIPPRKPLRWVFGLLAIPILFTLTTLMRIPQQFFRSRDRQRAVSKTAP